MKNLATAATKAINQPKVVNLELSPDLRPLAGIDIDYFRSRHERQTVDVIFALCIQNSAAYNRVLRTPYLKYSMEMLLRLYDMKPEDSPWKVIEPYQAFEMLYGNILKIFAGTEYESEARQALYRRFTAACGRSIYTAYRWVDSRGKCTRDIEKIFAKLTLFDNPSEVFETMAQKMYKARGVDFNELCPMPTLENPPLPKRKGPKPKSKKNIAV